MPAGISFLEKTVPTEHSMDAQKYKLFLKNQADFRVMIMRKIRLLNSKVL